MSGLLAANRSKIVRLRVLFVPVVSYDSEKDKVHMQISKEMISDARFQA